MSSQAQDRDYSAKLSAESRKWADHLEVEAAGEWNAWLDHPIIQKHYVERSRINGMIWEEWVKSFLGGPAHRSLDLGCGAGGRSQRVFRIGSSDFFEGIDISDGRIAEAEKWRQQNGVPGCFRVADVNTVQLPKSQYDLIFSVHSFHHFLELEHIMEQVHESLTPTGVFILEEYVGPTQLQWTELQLQIVRDLLQLIPENYRTYKNGMLKAAEGRSSPEEVEAASPFESIRSGEITELFRQHFYVVECRKLGGTLQHLLFNGIAHNFGADDVEAVDYIEEMIRIEDTLINAETLPSDFSLLIGMRKDSPVARRPIGSEKTERVVELENENKALLKRMAETELKILAIKRERLAQEEFISHLQHEVTTARAELAQIHRTLGWRLLSKYGPVKYKIILPALNAVRHLLKRLSN